MPQGDPATTSRAFAPFLPRLVMANPGTKVFPCQGTALELRLHGVQSLVAWYESRGSEGADDLSRLLSRTLDPLLEALERFGGDALELSSRGITALFPDEPDLSTCAARALACATALQKALHEKGEAPDRSGIPTLSGGIGLACGVLHGIVLGEPSLGQHVVFTGAALEQASQAAEAAAPGGILLQPSVGVQLDPDQVVTVPPLPTPALARLERLMDPLPPASRAPFRSDLPIASRFMAPALYPLVVKGGPPPSFRKLTQLTLQVTGIDPSAAGGIDPILAWFGRAQREILEQDGHIVHVALGSPQTVVAVFGAPIAHSDGEIRALRCALTLQRIARDLPSIADQRLGIVTGMAFVGILGEAPRRVYTAVGTRLELGQRLVNHAGPWEVLVDRHTVSRSGFGFDWGSLPPAPRNGDLELLTARLLYGEGAYGIKLTSRARGALVGRESLMTELRTLLEESSGDQGMMVSLIGPAGIGKSALLVWLGQHLQQTRHRAVYRGEGSALLRNAPYHAWMPIFKRWFDLQPDLPVEDARHRIEQRLDSLGADLPPRASLLSMVTGLDLPDQPAVRGLSARQRRDALQALVLELFHRAHAKAPIALLFEDCHWMDEASLELLRYLARNLAHLPVFIALTRRPAEIGQMPGVEALESTPGVRCIQVALMPPAALRQLACRHIGARALAPGLEQLLLARAGGSPLLLEELTLYLRDTDQIELARDGVAHQIAQPAGPLPETLREVILGRIARLDEGAQLTLKAASVVGRTFSLSLLQAIYPVPFDLQVLLARLERVEGLDIVRRELEEHRTGAVEPAPTRRSAGPAISGDSTFFFKHALIRDTIYDTLTTATRRSLHESVGLALERRLSPENRSELVLALAEHFRRTLRTDKQRIYFREAGDISLARALNQEAFAYYQAAEHLCNLAGDREGVADLLEAEVTVLNLLGDRDAQRDAVVRWKEVVQELGDDRRMADAFRAEGILFARIGAPDRAIEALERSRALARTRQDALQEARALRNLSAVNFQQGELPASLGLAEEALALAIQAQGWPDVSLIEANLGVILGRMNQTAPGRIRLEEALRRARAQGDLRWTGIFLSELGVLYMREGRYDRALPLLEQAVELKRKVGERHEEAITLNNLGYAWALLGGFEQARGYLEEALALSRQVEGRWSEASILENLAVVYQGFEDFEAARGYFEEALGVQEACGARAAQIETLERLARLELDQDRIDAAGAVVDRIVSSGFPLRPSLLSLTALIRQRQGDQAEAEVQAELAEAALIQEGSGGDFTAIALYELALVYRAREPQRGRALIEKSRSELRQRAERIEDRALRRQILEQVPEHREVLRAWATWPENGQTGEL